MTPAPTLSVKALRERCLDNLPGGRARFLPIVLLILGEVCADVIGWVVNRCLNHHFHETVRNPSWMERRQLRNAVRRGFVKAVQHPGVKAADLDPLALFRQHGDAVHKALLETGAGLTGDEIAALIVQHTKGPS
jgi:hypothetical protein